MWRFLLILAVAGFVAASVPGDVQADTTHEGKVSTVGEGKIAILAKSGDSQQFDVADDCKITLNGKTAKLSEIETGDVVTLTVKETKGKQVAITIMARDAE